MTAHYWGLHRALDPYLDSKEKDTDKVLLASLLRAHYDPGFKAGQVPKQLGGTGPAAAGPWRLSSNCSPRAATAGITEELF